MERGSACLRIGKIGQDSYILSPSKQVGRRRVRTSKHIASVHREPPYMQNHPAKHALANACPLLDSGRQIDDQFRGR